MPFRHCALVALFMAFPSVSARADSRVIKVVFPEKEAATVLYVERAPAFTVKLKAPSASVEAMRFYIGDGKVAVLLEAHSTGGVFLQGQRISQGYRFKPGSVLKVSPGHKKASRLKPGDIYVTLPGVTFHLPDE